MLASSTTTLGTNQGQAGKMRLVLIMLGAGVVAAAWTTSIGVPNYPILCLISTVVTISAWTLAVVLAARGSTAKHPVLCLKLCCMGVYQLSAQEFRNTDGVHCPKLMSHGD